ncbi:hypothetical protein Osc1_04040 [Hominimerdicola sp. 21CYCFAH17_S]
MNFFTLGYAFLAVQLNFGWVLNYILKLVGMLFMLGGISEISDFSKNFAVMKKRAYIPLGICTASCLTAAVFRLSATGGAVFSAVSVTAGAASAVAVFVFTGSLIKLLMNNNYLVNDVSNLSRLYSNWQKLAFFTGANILFDILNRAVPVSAIADFSGVMMTVTKIITYIFAVSAVWTFNKARMDFNNKHSGGSELSDK